jgi:cytochrome c biogenesis protein CcmG, thiol:disulfide interchange protein DsbE
MNHSNRIRCILLSIGLLIFAACAKEGNSPRVGDPLPRVELYGLKGDRVVLPDDFKNRVVIVRFWSDCCSYNINEMSRVEQIGKTYEGKGVRIVTIHTGSTRKAAEDYVSALKIEFPVLLDPDSKTAKRCGISEPPCTFILDREGVIRAKITGQVEGPLRPVYEKILTPLLN